MALRLSTVTHSTFGDGDGQHIEIATTGILEGDLVFLFFNADGNSNLNDANFTPDPGFNAPASLLNTQSSPDGSSYRVCYKVATASEPTNYDFINTAYAQMYPMMVVLSGRDGTVSIGSWITNTASNSSPVTANYNSYTAAAGDDVVAFASQDKTNFDATWDYSSITSFTTAQNTDGSAHGGGWESSMYGGVLENASAGTSTPSQTITNATGGGNTGFTNIIILAPASGGGSVDEEINAATGSLSVSGVNATLSADYALNAETGSLSVTGVNNESSIDLAINAEPSTISLSGVDTALTSDVSLNAEIGSLTVTGFDLTTTQDIDLNAETSSIDVTGIDATLGSLPVFNINAETGAVSITGVADNATIDYSINAEPSNVDVTGIDAALGSTTTFDLDAETGSVSISGVDSQLTRDLTLNAELGSIGITAPDATIGDNVVFNLNAETGAIAVTGVNNKVEYSLNFNAQPTSLAINGVDVQTGAGFSLNAETGLISVDGVDVVSTKDFVLNAEAGQIDVTAIDAFLSRVPLMPNAAKRAFSVRQNQSRNNRETRKRINKQWL